MKFIQSENINYRSQLMKDEIVKRFSDFIEPEGMGFYKVLGGSTKKYEGKISDTIFNIKKIVIGKSSFLPRISGVIHSDSEGTSIIVKMRLHISAVIFSVIWWVAFSSIVFIIALQAIINFEFNEVVWLTFILLLLTYAYVMLPFKLESIKSKKDLEEVFCAVIIED